MSEPIEGRDVEGHEPVGPEKPWLTRQSPSTGWVGCVSWFVLAGLVLGLIVVTIGIAGFVFDGGPVEGILTFIVVVGAAACFLVFVGKAMGEAQQQDTFRLYDDRVEITGETREMSIPYERIGHFELGRGGRIRFRAQSDMDAWAEEFEFATNRLHAEDEFDQWMDRVEICNPDGLYSISLHGKLDHSQVWTLEEVFGELGEATSASFQSRKVQVGAHLLPLRGRNGWTLRMAGAHRLRIRGEPCTLSNERGVVLGRVDRFAGGRRLTLGEFGTFSIPDYKGALLRDGAAVGKVEYTYKRAALEVEEPWPATLVALLLATGLYPNFYVLEV